MWDMLEKGQLCHREVYGIYLQRREVSWQKNKVVHTIAAVAAWIATAENKIQRTF